MLERSNATDPRRCLWRSIRADDQLHLRFIINRNFVLTFASVASVAWCCQICAQLLSAELLVILLLDSFHLSLRQTSCAVFVGVTLMYRVALVSHLRADRLSVAVAPRYHPLMRRHRNPSAIVVVSSNVSCHLVNIQRYLVCMQPEPSENKNIITPKNRGA